MTAQFSQSSGTNSRGHRPRLQSRKSAANFLLCKAGSPPPSSETHAESPHEDGWRRRRIQSGKAKVNIVLPAAIGDILLAGDAIGHRAGDHLTADRSAPQLRAGLCIEGVERTVATSGNRRSEAVVRMPLSVTSVSLNSHFRSPVCGSMARMAPLPSSSRRVLM